MIRAVLSNPAHPEYGVVTIPFPIPHDQYAHCMRTRDELVFLLEQDMRDCPMTRPQEREGESDREKSPISQNSI